jgi:hypothetical protein
MDGRDAKAELTHAAPALERAAGRSASTLYACRRRNLAERALKRV